MGFKLGPGSHGGTGARPPWRWIGVIALLCAVAAGWMTVRAIMGVQHRAIAEPEIDPRPVITSLQQVGDLHTVKMTMKDVLRQTSDKGAEGWLGTVPGGETLSRWATRNEALVVAQGTVEAGIDLSQLTAADVVRAQLSDGRLGLRVHLPQPKIYPPTITLHVENSSSGLLWKDENLIPKAEAEASRRFVDAAEKDGIQKHARENAIERLRQMQDVVGSKNIEFYF